MLFICLPAYSHNNSDFDSIIVQTKRNILSENRLSRLMYRSGVLRYQKIKDDLYIVPLDENDNADQKLSYLKKSRQFDIVELNYKLSIDQYLPRRNYVTIVKNSDLNNDSENGGSEVMPNDKGFSSQYYLRDINATKAWRTTVGSPLIVGILDTGVDVKHPDLTGKVLGGEKEGDLTDVIGHGTEVAGIIAADTNNTQGIAGVSWNAKVLSIKVTNDIGQAKVSSVVAALNEAYKKGAKIVQISLSTNQFSQVLKNAIKEAHDKGMLIISTGGNSGLEEMRYPAAFDGVIGVGAVDRAGVRESYSTFGEHINLVAPGSFIYTTSKNLDYREVNGTSFAAPQVAGTAALVWSLAPDLTNNEVREILFNSANDLGQPGNDKEYGHGLLNSEAAVELAKSQLLTSD